ncbi:hypothetical protein GCM10010519_04650 [Streptomyces lactacystinicus]
MRTSWRTGPRAAAPRSAAAARRSRDPLSPGLRPSARPRTCTALPLTTSTTLLCNGVDIIRNDLAFLPISRADGCWYLAVGSGRLRIRDEALAEDLDRLRDLMLPAPLREEVAPR